MCIPTRLPTKMEIAMPIKMMVLRNVSDSPSPNHAVSENGMYRLRNMMANRIVNNTVPSIWLFLNNVDGTSGNFIGLGFLIPGKDMNFYLLFTPYIKR